MAVSKEDVLHFHKGVRFALQLHDRRAVSVPRLLMRAQKAHRLLAFHYH
jgi:hypothetical protein